MNDQQHMARVALVGCIVCLKRLLLGYVPAEVHHILKSGRRISHRHTIGLCTPHHRGGMNTEEIVSRHPWKREFEKRYGTESELLELTREELDRVGGY
jgi:hypothetical protein